MPPPRRAPVKRTTEPPRPREARVRRSPEQARAHLLEAAGRVFARHLPDTVGLKDVAREAGVSHALVTHYFGTYEALVEATLERRFHRLREELLPLVLDLIATDAGALDLLRAHRAAVVRACSDPATIRLLVWALLSGRAAADDFFPHRMQGLKLLAGALEARSAASREDLEFLLVVSLALATVWTFGGRALAGALGRETSSELDDGFERRTERLIATFLRTAERGDSRPL